MRRLVPVMLVALPLVTRADEAYDGGPKPISPISLRAYLDGATVLVTARFTIAAGSGEASYTFTMPPNAVITGATVTRDGGPHRLALQRAEVAADHFEEARSGTWASETAKTKDPIRRSAAIVTAFGDEATVSLLGHRAGPVVLEVELTSTTCFDDDARYIGVDDAWLPAIEPRLKHRPPKNIVDRCGFAGDHMTWIGFPSTELASRHSGDARIGATAGRLALGREHVARVELDIAATLADIPPDLATVILVDGSRSMSHGELETQRQIVESYVRVAKATRVQVIAYTRTARALLPSWSMASAIAPRLDRELRALVTRNGSNVDAGMLEAGAWLSRIAGTRRVVLLTDERMPNRLEDVDGVAWKKLLPPGTLVHVVTIDDGADALVKNPDAMFGKLATATAGLAVRGGASDETPAAAELLVHPIALDDVVVRSEGWKVDDSLTDCAIEDDEALHQGDSCTWWFDGSALSGPIVIEGKIWGVPVTRTLRPDPTKGMALARELVGRGSSFEEEKQTLVEDAAHAVSSGWSLFAAWGGTTGHGDLVGFGRYSTGGDCCSGDIGGGGTMGFGTINATHLDLRWQLRNALRACHAERERVEVTLETTLVEIAGVAVKAKTASIATCIEEAIWETTLAIDHPALHETSEFGLGPL